DSHTRVWITTRDARLIWPARLLDVFAERELDPRHRSRKQELAGRTSILDLHDCVQSTNRIRRTVQEVESRHTARKLTIKIDVGRIQYILRVDHRGDGECAFVNRVEH